jgi:hypothetical protein
VTGESGKTKPFSAYPPAQGESANLNEWNMYELKKRNFLNTLIM